MYLVRKALKEEGGVTLNVVCFLFFYQLLRGRTFELSLLHGGLFLNLSDFLSRFGCEIASAACRLCD